MVIVGAGVIGLSVARELSRRDLSILILEKESDVGRGASGRNSGVVHPGFSVAPGTLKARLNAEGSRLIRSLCDELSVPFREVGTLVVATREDEKAMLEPMLEAGRANGLTRLEIVGADELRRLEPGVTGCAALHAPEGAIIDPFALVLRLAESCLANGCDLALDTPVTGLARDADERRARNNSWIVSTPDAEVRATVVVNAAGIAAPAISAMAGAERFESFPCRGEYLVLDRLARGVPGRMVYPVPPTAGGLGVHFTPTTNGNTLIGPSAEYIADGEDYGTTRSIVPQLFEEAAALCPGFSPADVISSFAGVRAKISKGAYGRADFVIEESRATPGLVNLIGIESPGLTASPAVGKMAAGIVLTHFPNRPTRPGFMDGAPPSFRFADMTDDERAAKAASDEDAGTIVCRCEQVTRGEVLEALRNPIGARSFTAVKARCRAGTGRCQGGFCTPRIVKIMRDELGMPVDEVLLRGPDSQMFVGEAKCLFGLSEPSGDEEDVVG